MLIPPRHAIIHRIPRLRGRPPVVAFLASFALLAAVLLPLLLRGRARLLDAAGRDLQEATAMMAARMDAGLRAWAVDVEALAGFGTFAEQPPNIAQARRLLEDLQRRSPEFSWIGFTDARGTVLAATGGLLEGQDVSARPWFIGGTRGLFLGDVHPAVLLDRLLGPGEDGQPRSFVDAAAPVRGADGRLLGVVAGHMDWRWAGILRTEVMAGRGLPATALAVLDAEGKVLLGAPPALAPGQLARIAADQPRAVAREAGGMLLAHAHTSTEPGRPSLHWTVVATRPAEEVLAPLRGTAAWLALATLAGALAAGWLVGRATRRFGRSLRMLTGATEARGTGAELRGLAATLRDLRRRAEHDPLTGLRNRTGLAAWRAANPGAEDACAVIVFDLDGFKPINDARGHAAGDAVLTAIGHWLSRHLRTEDCAVRLGGDEFLLVLPGTDADGAAEVIQRLRHAMHDGMPTAFGPLSLGCSAGIALVPEEAPTLEEAMHLADLALYAEKGRRVARAR